MRRLASTLSRTIIIIIIVIIVNIIKEKFIVRGAPISELSQMHSGRQ